MIQNNLFLGLPENLIDEDFSTILQKDNIKIERIISKGHTTADGQWYDQAFNEWVLVLQGKATLQLFQGEQVTLGSGDYYFIPAHLKHRVEWTDPVYETIWLAVTF